MKHIKATWKHYVPVEEETELDIEDGLFNRLGNSVSDDEELYWMLLDKVGFGNIAHAETLRIYDDNGMEHPTTFPNWED